MTGMKGMQMNARLSTPMISSTWMSAFGDYFIGSTWYQSAYSHSQGWPG